jgi:hypothetical protein
MLMRYQRRDGGVDDDDADFVCPTIRKHIGSFGPQHWGEKPGLATLERLVSLELKPGIFTRCRFRVAISLECSVPFDLKLVLDYVEAVVGWVGSLYWSTSTIEQLNITLWLTPFRKVWCPKSGEINLIGRCEVNSGETSFVNSKRRDVTVWRVEDWSKVLLHELLHAFNWDHLVPKTSDNQSEALVETMATILHCQLLGGPLGWSTILETERKWMIQHVRALISYQWKPDKTSVRSYYILKAALIFALPEFARWLRQTDQTMSQMHNSWKAMASDCVAKLLSNLSKTTNTFNPASSACLSMRMVFSQLSLNPKPA